MFGFRKVGAISCIGAVLLAFVGMLCLGVIAIVFIDNCSGQMSACYRVWRTPDSIKRERDGALTQFAASQTAVAFPVVLDNEDRGLLFIDRSSGLAKLIYEKGRSFWSPHLSADGRRLVLIARHDAIASKEIISCSIATWRCAVLLRTEDNLRSPIELDADTIVYSASPLFVGSTGRHLYMDWDFYLLKNGSAQVRLSDFKLHELHSISLAKDRLFFSGVGSKPDNQVLPNLEPLAANRSEVFAVELDQEAQKVRKPLGLLARQFMIGGYSWEASASRDGHWAAVLNTVTGKGRYRFDMVLVTIDGTVQRRIDVEGMYPSGKGRLAEHPDV
jgi:hypothetical protein